MSIQKQRKVAKAEVTNTVDKGARANDLIRVEGLQGLLKLRENKARVQQSERLRLREKYGRNHPRTRQVEKNLNATVDVVSGLHMELARAKTKVVKPDPMVWVVHGHVYDGAGKPLKDADVNLFSVTGESKVDKVPGEKTDSKGYYQIRFKAGAGDLKQAGGTGTGELADSGQPPAQEADSQEADGGGLRINTNLDQRKTLNFQQASSQAVFVRASVAGSPDIFADSSALIPKAGACHYRDIIVNQAQAGDKQHQCDSMRSTRYLGNARNRELHDLKNEKPGCRIDKIRFDNAVNFKTIEKAVEAGYDFCAYCFGKEKSKR